MSNRNTVRLVVMMLLIATGCGGASSDDEDATETSATISDTRITGDIEASPSRAAIDPNTVETSIPSCDDTEPVSQPPGVPFTPMHTVWYGVGSVWFSPATLSGVNPSLPEGPGHWYQGDWPIAWFIPPETVVEAHARPVERPSEMVAIDIIKADRATAAIPASAVTFDDSGCWEIAGTIDGEPFAVTFSVLPFEARPDVVAASELSALARPFPVPVDDCAPTPLTLQDPEGRLLASYWAEGEGIAMRIEPPGVLREQAEVEIDWFVDPFGEITITGSSQVASTPPLVSGMIQRSGTEGSYWTSTLTFLIPGCWTVTATSDARSLDVTLYVYPADCWTDATALEPVPCGPEHTS